MCTLRLALLTKGIISWKQYWIWTVSVQIIYGTTNRVSDDISSDRSQSLIKPALKLELIKIVMLHPGQTYDIESYVELDLSHRVVYTQYPRFKVVDYVTVVSSFSADQVTVFWYKMATNVTWLSCYHGIFNNQKTMCCAHTPHSCGSNLLNLIGMACTIHLVGTWWNYNCLGRRKLAKDCYTFWKYRFW